MEWHRSLHWLLFVFVIRFISSSSGALIKTTPERNDVSSKTEESVANSTSEHTFRWSAMFWDSPSLDVIPFETKLHLTINATELESKCFESSTIMLNGLGWKVKFCKMSGDVDDELTDSLDAYLIASFNGDDDVRLYDAVAVFELVSANPHRSDVAAVKLKEHFSSKSPKHSIPLVNWDTFLLKYVHENLGELRVKIRVGPKHIIGLDTSKISTTFRAILSDIDEMGEVLLQPVEMQGAHWDIIIKKIDDELDFYLHQNDWDRNVNEWSWNVTLSFLILPVKESANLIIRKGEHVFNHGRYWRFPSAINWSDFIESYVENNKAVFVIKLAMKPPSPLWEID